MERLRRIAQLWSWLPAFRAVAETEHLHRAAEMLGTSAPALSRTIRLLEDSLDAPLFRRNGGKHMELTALGQVLAAATRECMRRVDEALTATAPDFKLTGGLRVSREERLPISFSLTALLKLRLNHPELVPLISCAPASEVLPRLLRGDLDAALVFQPTPHPNIDIERLGIVNNGVYCAPGHPLHSVELPTLPDVLNHPFVAPESCVGAPCSDGWPAEHARRIALYTATLAESVEACASGDLLVVLPDRAVPTFASAAILRRLPLEIVPPSVIYAMKRAPVVARLGGAEAFLHEIKQDMSFVLAISDRPHPAQSTPTPQA